MIKDEIRSILKTLLERSKAKQVDWTSFGETPYDDDFTVSFPKSSVNVFKNKDGVIRASIMNGSGTTVGSIASEDSESDSAMLEELFNCAREDVFKVDETLADIKRALARGDVTAGPRNAPLITEDDIPF